MANSLIQIKQSFTNTVPVSLNVGELAYSYVSNSLFIGTQDNAGYINIGGFSSVLRYDEAYNHANSGFIQANAAFIRANNSLNANLGGQVTGVTTFNSNTRASSNTTGDLVVVGGAAVKGNVYTGSIYITGNGLSGTLNAIVFGDGTTQNTSPAAIGLSANLAFGNANGAFAKSNAAYNTANAAFIRANNAVNANLGGTITATTVAVSNTSGALIVAGGVGIKGNVYTGSIVLTGPSNTITFVDGTVQNTSPIAAGNYANSAFVKTNSAFGHANAAYLSQNATGQYANAAFDHANSAFIKTNSAFSHANSAYESQNATGQYANAAYTRANNSLSANVGGTVTGDVTISGNLTVIGNTTYVNSSQTLIADNILTLNAAIDQASAPILNAGIEIDRGIDANVYVLWNEGTDKWTVTNNGTNYFNIGSDAAESYANSAFIKANASFDHANAAYLSQNATGQYANSALVHANSAYQSQNATGQYANSAFIQANAAFGHANAAYVSQNATGQYANAAFIRANNSLNANVGGQVTGDVTFVGNVTSNTITTTGSNGSISGANAIFTNYIFAANGNVDLYIYSSNAYANANGGFAKANAAFANANGAFATANAAYNHANSAYQSQNATGQYANSAFVHANSAFIHANAAYQSQNATGQYANSAFVHANSAYESQNATGQYANSAFVHANSAYQSQNATGQYANSAFIHANSAYQSQNATGQYANSAFIKANASFDHANSAFIRANNSLNANVGGRVTGFIDVTQNVSIGTYIDLATDQNNPTKVEGRIFYDKDQHALGYYNESDMTFQIGQETVVRVWNNTGSQIVDGKPVYIAGASSANGFPGIALASAATAAQAEVIGLTTTVIPNGGYGYVTVQGKVNGLDTSAFTAGQELFLSDTPGQYQTTAPASPSVPIVIGYVASVDVTNGSILVRVHSMEGRNKSNGAILFGRNGSIDQDPTTLYWDYANNSLGVGTDTPQANLHVTGSGLFTGNVTISGNLNVTNANFISTSELTVTGNTILLSDGTVGTPTLNAEIIVNRGSSPNSFIRWDESIDEWVLSEGGATSYHILTSGKTAVTWDDYNAFDTYEKQAYPIGANLSKGIDYQANAAFAKANLAETIAISGFIQANSGFDHANAAYLSQNATGQYANAAFNHANAAYDAANNVFPQIQPSYDTANAAFIQANIGYNLANSIANNSTVAGTANVAKYVEVTPRSDAKNYNVALVDATTGNLIIGANTGLTYHPTLRTLSAYVGQFASSVTTTSLVPASTVITIFNTTATTIRMGGAATTINIGNVGGTTNVFGTLAVNGVSVIGFTQGAYNTGNSAFIQSNSAFDHANAAFAAANNVFPQVQPAYDTANAAFIHANSAYQSQNATGQYANSAFETANSAAIYANGAFTAANVADGKAVASGNYANAAFVQANVGITHAQSSFEVANSAAIYANGAFVAANVADGKAVNAGVYANAAFNHANAAFESANNVAPQVQPAFNTANAAFIRANNSLNANVGGQITGDVSITGNLIVTGNTVYANAQTVLIADNIITLNAAINQSAAPTMNAGIEVDRGNQPNVALLWNETVQSWQFTNDGSTYESFGGGSSGVYANGAFVKANAAYNHANAAFDAANTGGGAVVTFAATPPATGNSVGDLWIDSGDGTEYTYFNDNNTYQWVEFGPTGANVVSNTFITANVSAQYNQTNLAFNQANSSFNTGNSAFIQANAAFIQANTPSIIANVALLQANAAFDQANTANTIAIDSTRLAPNLKLNIIQVLESANIFTTAISGNVNIDIGVNTSYFFSSNTTGNVTFNLRGTSSASFDTTVATGQTASVAIALKQGATKYKANVYIDGVLQTPYWLGNSSPSYATSQQQSIDVYTYTIFKTAASTYSILAANSNFGLAQGQPGQG